MEVTGETLMSNDDLNPTLNVILPDCQDLSLAKFSDRIRAMAEDRGNSASGDARMGKAMQIRVAMINAIHHEVRSAYLAGYLQATKDQKRTDVLGEL